MAIVVVRPKNQPRGPTPPKKRRFVLMFLVFRNPRFKTKGRRLSLTNSARWQYSQIDTCYKLNYSIDIIPKIFNLKGKLIM